jgi:type I restriction enzyme M protein
MIDARNVYRKVTRKIYDFSPEQEQNLLAIVWLYRGSTEKYLELVAGYCQRTLTESTGCLPSRMRRRNDEPLPSIIKASDALRELLQPFLKTLNKDGLQPRPTKNSTKPLPHSKRMFKPSKNACREQELWKKQKTTNGELKKAVERLAPLAGLSRDLTSRRTCSLSSCRAS